MVEQQRNVQSCITVDDDWTFSAELCDRGIHRNHTVPRFTGASSVKTQKEKWS